MKKICSLTVIILLSLNSFAQNSDKDFYIKLKKMDLGQIEEKLTLDGWNFESMGKCHDYLLMTRLSDYNIKRISFKYLRNNSKETKTDLIVYKFSSSEKDNLVRLETTDFNFYQNLLKSITDEDSTIGGLFNKMIGKGFSLEESYEGEGNGHAEFSKYGDEIIIKPFVKIYSNGSLKIKIKTYKLVKYINYEDEILTYEEISNYYSIEF